MHAYCFASGLIEFADKIPSGALPIGRGPREKLIDWLEATARHGYQTERVDGRLQKIPGTDCLIVPGVPEAPDQGAALDALKRFTKWASQSAPKEIVTVHSAHRIRSGVPNAVRPMP